MTRCTARFAVTVAFTATNLLALVACDETSVAPDAGPPIVDDGSVHVTDDGGVVTSDGALVEPDAGALPEGSNRSPIVTGETFVTLVDTAIALGDLLDNDHDPEGDALRLVVDTEPAHGTLADGTYTPASGFVGPDRIDYTVHDDRGGSASASVFVYVARRGFYVSSEGDDDADGRTPATAWRTLAKVQSMVFSSTFEPGDAILLRRGDTFRGTISIFVSGTAEEPLVLADYGDGPKPRVLGSQRVTGWTARGDGSYTAPFPSDPGRLYVGGTRVTKARFPNEGWLRNDGGDTTHLTDAELPGPAGRWDGATIRVRSVNWAYDAVRVASHTNGRIDFEDPIGYSIHEGGWGYFFDGVEAALDAPGEWIYADGELRLIPPAGTSIDALEVEAPLEPKGVELTGNHQVVANLEVAYQRDVGLDFNYLKHHVTARHLHVHDNYMGARAYDDDILVYECLFERSDASGVKMSGARIQIERSVIRDIAMQPGFGESTWGYIGVDVGGTDSVVRDSVIEDIGYIGLAAAGDGTILERNVVRRALAILNDGSGIAFDHTDGLIVRDNVVLDTIGSMESASATQLVNYRIAFGIYFGNTDIQNTTIERNVVARHGTGIHVDHTTRSRGNAVRDNLTFENEKAIQFSDFSNDRMPPPSGMCVPEYDDAMTGNTFIASREGDRILHIFEVHCLDDLVWWGGGFDHNRYLAPYTDVLVTRLDFHSPDNDGHTVNDDFTFEEWQAHTGQEASSSTWALPDEAPELVLFVNEDRGPRTIRLDGPYRDLDGAPVAEELVLAPLEGMVLVRGVATP